MSRSGAGTIAWVVAACFGALACTNDEPEEAEPTVAAAPAAADRGVEIHEGTGLVIGEDWELVASHCTSCHSVRQLRRQGGTRETWQAAIDWMQATQGVPEFPPGVEDRIVTYLATHYGPSRSGARRAPLPPELMPPNPYAVGTGAK